MHIEPIGCYFILYETGKFLTPIRILTPLEVLNLIDDLEKCKSKLDGLIKKEK